jgi:hypothetical protein
MEAFSRRHQLEIQFETSNYYKMALTPEADLSKIALSLPIPVPITTICYALEDGTLRSINVYPTLQFLYSHHIQAEYISPEVKDAASAPIQPDFVYDAAAICKRFLSQVAGHSVSQSPDVQLTAGQPRVLVNYVRHNPQYTLAALQEGVYVIGMRDQFNVHDMQQSPLNDCIQHVVDDLGFVLFDRAASANKSTDSFGPYFIGLYILMEVLSKQEVSQNVLDYYLNHKQTLQDSLAAYTEEQGKGFICWRFLMKDSGKGKACASPVLRALARGKTVSAPAPAPAPTHSASSQSAFSRIVGFLSQ